MEIPVKRTSLIIAVAFLSMAAGSSGSAAELPTYAAAGLPISPAQAAVIGASGATEQARTSEAASPHQVQVLKPHIRKTADAGAR